LSTAAPNESPPLRESKGARLCRRWMPALLFILFAALLAGCTTRWRLRSEQPAVALQWPYQPSAAKLTYERSLTGFAASATTAAKLSAVVFGTDSADLGAFLLPVAIATGSGGRIAVADLGRRSVHLYVPERERHVALRGAGRDLLETPVGVAFDERDNLYVSDSSGKLLAFDAEGALRFALRAAGGEPLQRPTGIAYSPGRKLLYVADTLAHRIHALTPSGELAFSFGGRGDGAGQFNFPTHLFRSAAGELYVTDALNFRIAIFDEGGRPRGSFGHHGDGSGDLALPKGVAVDGDGVVYVVDGMFDNVQLFDRQGTFLLTVGRRGTDFGELWLPSGAFADGERLYVCDTYNHRVQVFRITPGYGASGDAR